MTVVDYIVNPCPDGERDGSFVEDVGVLEVDDGVLNWVRGENEDLADSVEFDCVGGLVHSVCFLQHGHIVVVLLSVILQVLFQHILNVTDLCAGLRRTKLSGSSERTRETGQHSRRLYSEHLYFI